MPMKTPALLALLPALAVAQDVVLPAPEPPPPALPHFDWFDPIPPSVPDEKPCEVAALDVDARVDGLRARVSTTITLRNPNDRPISAPLAFPLPDGAAVCGYALEIDGDMVPAVVVEKERARVAFETEQRRGVDPGLVEAVKGNVYRTRVYPVPARGARRVRIDHVCPLALGADGASAALALPMPDCTLAARKISIEVADTSAPEAPTLGGFGDRRFEKAERVWRVVSEEADVAARDDVLVALPRLPDAVVSLERTPEGEIFFEVSVATKCENEMEPPAQAPLRKLDVFWDASASHGAVDHAAALAALTNRVASAEGEFRLFVVRDTVEPPRAFPTLAALAEAVAALDYDGGTDLAAVAAALRAGRGPALLFTDGLDTLSGAVFDIGGRADVVAVVDGPERDLEPLRQACGGRAYDAAHVPPIFAGPDGAFRVWDATRLRAVRADGTADLLGVGDPAAVRATVLGRLVAETAELALVVDPSDGVELAAAAPTLRAADARPGTTLAAAWAARRVQRLAPRADDNAAELLALGRRYGVVSPATSLIVLESLDQWLRHDIEPPAALSDLRARWLAAKKSAASESPEAKAARHLDAVAKAWAERKAWWEKKYDGVYRPPKPVSPQDVVIHHQSAMVMGDSSEDDMDLADDSGAEDDMDLVEDGEVEDDMEVAAAPAAAAPAAPAPAALRVPASRHASAAKAAPPAATPAASIEIKAWSPDTPYLKKLAEAADPGGAREAYLLQKKEWGGSPAFYLDCAGWFFEKGDRAFAVRVLSNLAELRIEDAALLRVLAWRLLEADAFDPAIVALRRVTRLRPEDPQSWRDLALALEKRARAGGGRKDAEEALRHFDKVIGTPWQRHAVTFSLIALEERNAFADWCLAQPWWGEEAAEPPDPRLAGVLDCDLRVVMAWDADETDIDLHVTEPSGEEAYYGHRRTAAGGDVSEDITDGYGPEQYEIRRAPKGEYNVRAHYFASHQQAVFGPATCTATLFTDWGRSNQVSRPLSIRLDKARETATLGSFRKE